jgi:hypothetical protein
VKQATETIKVVAIATLGAIETGNTTRNAKTKPVAATPVKNPIHAAFLTFSGNSSSGMTKK